MPDSAAGRWVLIIAVLITSAVSVGYWYAFMENQRDMTRRAMAVTGGDPEHGRRLVRSTGCAGCHDIPGVDGATATVGPPLSSLSRRVYIGVVLNTPENLIQWLQNPQSIDPMAAMPNVGLTEHDARDVAAFLYTLE